MRNASRGIAVLLALMVAGATSSAQARIEVECVPGRPFGVGRITLDNAELRGLNENAVQITDRDGRIHYPAFRYGRALAVIGEALGIGNGGPNNLTITFLFEGDAPLRATVFLPTAIEVDLVPRARGPRDHGRMLARWWRDYHVAIRDQREMGDYPPWVQTYLSAMLSRRLGMASPLLNDDKPVSENYQVLELLAGTERIRDAALRDTVLGRVDYEEPADLPLPRPIDWPELEPPFDENVKIEAIAQRVPRECGYIRFGRFANFLWFNKLLEEYGGDLGRLVTTRGFQKPMNNRLQEQLQLRTDALSELLGDTVISDVALIGRDFFMAEGPAMGVLFQARNTDVLKNDFSQKRKAALDREKKDGCTLETVKIAGRDVTFLSTPDNRIRSFYAIEGDYHLVTNSRAIVERFFATGEGEDALGDLAEFRHARTEMPLDREDTVFAYFSTWFLRGLVSPHYQVELRRRLQCVTDLEVFLLARLAARGEDLPGETIDELIERRLLPPGFGERPDGSGLVVTDSVVLDSLRGRRGNFAPIPDITIEGITATEARRLAEQAQFYAQNWKQMDPVFVGIRRFRKNDEGLERIVVDAHVAPFEESKYGWVTSLLGPPSRTVITSARGDVIHVQALLNGGLLDPTLPPHHMFLGVQDHLPLTDIQPTSLLKTLQLLRTTPGYLGAWPKTGFLDRLPLGLGGGEPDAFGYSRLPFGLWRRQSVDGFSVLSFDPNVLAKVTPDLEVAEADEPAQVRVRIDDLSRTKLAGLVNTLYFEQARRTSVGNARFVQLLVQQLQVPIDEGRATAEQLLDAKLVCPLGGEYKIVETRTGAEYWVSTAWPRSLDYELPRDYVAPLLVWFRGFEGGLTKSPNRLFAHLELEMQREKSEQPPQLELPLFNIFGGGKKAKPEKEELPETPRKKLFPENPPPRPQPERNNRQEF